MKKRTYRCVLTIAGSDSGGGAGIQADLKTFAALGCYGASAITALTAQNTTAVTAIYEVPATFVTKQIDTVLDDIGVNAVKTGMLGNAEIIRAVAKRLRIHKITNIVVDPVMISKSGAKLLRDSAVSSLRSELIPLATVVTPNIPEASILANQRIRNRTDMENAGTAILSLGPKAVLLKGGHTKDHRSADCLCVRNKDGKVEIFWLEGKRILTKNTHGTGCTLSSAIAAHLAKGLGIKEAVVESKKYISGAIKAGTVYRLGKGHGPVHHFHALWKK